MKVPKNILALVPNWIGDAAMCTAALRAIHNRFPDAALAVAGRESVCDLLRGLPWLSALLPLQARGGVGEMLRAARVLKPHAADLAVVFPHSFRAALLAFMTRARRRIGHNRNGRGWLLTDKVEPCRENGQIMPVYMAREYLELVAPLGCVDDARGLELAAAPEDIEAVRAFLGEKRPRVGIAAGAAFGPSKMWPAERYAAVADQLTETLGAECVLITGPGEEAVRDRVMKAAKRPMKCLDAQFRGIRYLKAAVSQLDLLIGNDSGVRHVAVAFHVPTVCIMGSTRPAYSCGPYEKGRVVRVDVDCGPCQKPDCETDHRCMTQITVEMIVDAAKDILST